MDANNWTYAAVIVSIGSALFGTSVAGYLFWKIWKHKQLPEVHVAWLLVVIALMSLAQIIEQTRVLMFRLSYDRVIDPKLFDWLYSGTWHVTLSKLMFASALSAGTALKLALYCERSPKEIAWFSVLGGLTTFSSWWVCGLLIDYLAGS